MRLLILLALLVTTANAEASTWKLFLIGESGSAHLQTHTELPYAGDPIHFVFKAGCIELGINLILAKRDIPQNTIIGFYCEEVTLGRK